MEISDAQQRIVKMTHLVIWHCILLLLRAVNLAQIRLRSKSTFVRQADQSPGRDFDILLTSHVLSFGWSHSHLSDMT